MSPYRRSLDACHRLDGFARRRHEVIDLLLRDDQWRREEHVLGARACDDAALVQLLQHARPDLLVGSERRLGRAILHQLDGGQQSLAATNVADVPMIAELFLESLVEPRAHRGRALPQTLAFHDLEVLEAYG